MRCRKGENVPHGGVYGLMRNHVSNNPLLAPSSLPFQAPPFDTMTDDDVRPALDEGMRRHVAEIAD